MKHCASILLIAFILACPGCSGFTDLTDFSPPNQNHKNTPGMISTITTQNPFRVKHYVQPFLKFIEKNKTEILINRIWENYVKGKKVVRIEEWKG